ncbi:FAD-dependent oxidoreductase [Stappia sp. F7233]|uniref:FAD-dependent oxidoreductase n=1 Tax=Stappia albiluteola TaxID=2758565 RepID=A0A839ABY8_9HYPH|nr:FAD-dependent oxidoreductase [Stappia albiluteola]MBA5776199.1 FAD-dependent oxidoreductase [Stappia albiluteola]
MARNLTPDICVIGAGSGGLTVAAAAASFGVDVVLVEKGLMGGDCLNYGCVPSKALIAAAERAHAARMSAQFGVHVDGLRVDFAQVHDHVHDVIAGIAPHDSVERFEGLGVTVIQAEGRFVDPSTVVAGDATIKARRFVIATGSRAAVPPIPGLDKAAYLTNETVFELTRLPDHLIIIGAGPIGLELAQAHRRLGAEVTVVEAEKALGRDDPELAAIVLDRVRAEGVEILEQAKVVRVEEGGAGPAVVVEASGDERRIEGSHLLVATGRRPNVENLGLDAAGIAFDRRGITVDKGLRTSNRKVYAIGDVAGGLQFTHVAGYHAGLVVRSILFRLPVRDDRDMMPRVTFTSPEIGGVGLSEAQARSRFADRVRVVKAAYCGNDRARAERTTDGMVKLVIGPRGRLLGAEIVGSAAGEVVNLLSLALSRGVKVGQLAGFVSPYPTLSEVVKRAAISYYADAPKNLWVRRIVGFLSKFG